MVIVFKENFNNLPFLIYIRNELENILKKIINNKNN